MKNKIKIQIVINNIVGFFVYSFVSLLLNYINLKVDKKSILFINTGQIGDLIVSSSLLERQLNIYSKQKIILLIREEYLELFEDYSGAVKIIGFNDYKYKYSIFYKVKFLISLRKLGFSVCFNLTAARTSWNNEMCLLSGAIEKYALFSDWKYLNNIFRERFDRKYTKILAKGLKNEYDKHEEVLKYLNKQTARKKQIFDLKDCNILNSRDYIVIAPFSSTGDHDWPIENFRQLFRNFGENENVILIGSLNQKIQLDELADNFDNIIVLSGKLKLNKIPSLISNSKLFIGMDSGLTHIAIKVNTPTIAIIGGGNYNRFLPKPSDNKTIYLAKKMECFGCEWRCTKKKVFCVDDILVSDVYSNALKLLQNSL